MYFCFCKCFLNRNLYKMKQYIPQVIATGVILLLNPLLKVFLSKIIRRSGELMLKSDVRMMQVVRIVNILVNFSCILTLTIIWGVKPENLLVAISSIFAVVGVAMFAQWSILSNITAGIIIFFSMPFRIGDEIKIMDKDYPIEATIENIFTFVIHLRSKEGELIVLSNSLFLQKTVSVKDNK